MKPIRKKTSQRLYRLRNDTIIRLDRLAISRNKPRWEIVEEALQEYLSNWEERIDTEDTYCSKCLKPKKLDDFPEIYNKRLKKMYRRKKCIDCQRAYQRAHRKKNVEEFRAKEAVRKVKMMSDPIRKRQQLDKQNERRRRKKELERAAK